MWAATWLYIATRRPAYFKYITEESVSGSVAEFSWDLKYAGAQILLSEVLYNVFNTHFINLHIVFLILQNTHRSIFKERRVYRCTKIRPIAIFVPIFQTALTTKFIYLQVFYLSLSLSLSSPLCLSMNSSMELSYYLKFLGGMVHMRDGANTQYVTGTAFLFSAYSDILATHQQTVQCGGQQFGSAQLMTFAKKQVLSCYNSMILFTLSINSRMYSNTLK